MPEGPEVREYYEFVNEILLDKKIINIKILSGKYVKKFPEHWDKIEMLLPNIVKKIFVKGKTIFMIFSNDLYLSFTHGMTGWWDEEYMKHSRIVFEIEGGDKLYYNDTRNFGKCSVYINKFDFDNAVNLLGPDVLKDLTYQEFYSRISSKKKSKIGSVLLDQRLICGIGNYMRCDILWYAKIHYTRTIESLNDEDRNNLYNSVKEVCNHYLNYNLNEDNSEYCFIYYKNKDLYGNSVKRKKWLGRTIHYVEW